MTELAGEFDAGEELLRNGRERGRTGHVTARVGVRERAKAVPILPTLAGPEQLRALTNEHLRGLASEIRECLMETVSRNGGHLSSNLGVVELTIALHKAFDFARDRIVFDVGHQVYVHKLLTGRFARFHTLRTQGGLCGYPNPEESRYDVFLTGHAGTAISSALGLAVASKLTGDSRRHVAVVGDGAITAGMSLEALNHAGGSKSDLLVVLNDNEHSISRTTGAMSNYLSRVRSWSLYNDLMDRTGRLLQRLPVVGREVEQIRREVVERALNALSAGVVFEEFGFRYYGPVDGHSFDALFRALNDVSSLKGPVLLHVLTQKGRGFSLTANDPVKYHSPAPFTLPGSDTERIELTEDQLKILRAAKPAPSAPLFLTNGKAEAASVPAPAEAKKPVPYTDVVVRALMESARQDPRVVAITAAMPTGTGLSAFADAFPGRYIDVGICEQHAVTFAAGLAKGGLRPVVCIYSTFLQRAADQLMHDVSLQGGLPVLFCMDRAGLVGTDGATHHGVLDISWLAPLPHFVLMAPKDGDEAEAMFKFALALDRPVGLRYPRDKAPASLVGGKSEPIRLGKGEVLRRGDGVAILGYGSCVAEALKAAEDLHEDGIDVTVANARFAKPVDGELIEELLATHRCVITAEEHQKIGGFGAMVTAEAQARGLDARRIRVLGISDEYIEHAPRSWQLAYCGLDATALAKAVREAMD